MKILFSSWLYEFWLFGLKQAWASLYGGLLLLLIIITHYHDMDGIARYDFLFIGAILIQLSLILFNLESTRETKIIFVFHIVATIMELFKTHPLIGSWAYPESCFFKIDNVPLFTGFMYSAVGSYIARSGHILQLRYSHYPKLKWTVLLALMIYINFFTHHFIMDFRWLLLLILFVLFWKTKVHFRIKEKERQMPLCLGFSLIAIFIWIAENFSTYARIWIYPDQIDGWTMVSGQKIIAWFLLMTVSFVMVNCVNTRQSRTSGQLVYYRESLEPGLNRI